MFNKNANYRIPKSVDEAAELLLSDLLLQHLQTLTQMTEDEYDQLCEKIAPYMLEEFKIWQGNDDLLNSCFNHCEEGTEDPTRIILNRVKKMLDDFHGFLVIT
jgi:hypothetical protein